MTDCTPQALMEAARCMRCIPQGMQSAVSTYLMCQWANAGPTPPAVLFEWLPHASLMQWIDDTGVHITDWDTFAATANNDQVTDIDSVGPGTIDLTDILNADTLPALVNLTVTGNPGITLLDLTDCFSLVNLSCDFCGLAGNAGLILTNCISLQVCVTDFNGLLTAINFDTCGQMDTITCSNCDLTGNNGLKLDDCIVLASIDASNNTKLTKAVCTFSNNLNNAAFDGCDLTGLAGYLISTTAANVSVTCSGNVNLVALDLSGVPDIVASDFSLCTSLTTVTMSTSTFWLLLLGNGCNLSVASVDGILNALATFSLGNAGNCDLDTPATNASPTGGFANPDYVALTTTFPPWTVAIN